jgi:hypothetical protein
VTYVEVEPEKDQLTDNERARSPNHAIDAPEDEFVLALQEARQLYRRYRVIFQVVKGERSPMNRSESKIENT